MSTSHYSRPHVSRVAPNRRRWTAFRLAIIGALLLVDMLALIGSNNLGESLAFAGLVIVNLWALTATK